MTDAQRRATRTLLQTLPGSLLVTGWNLFAPPDRHLNAEQAAWIVAVITPLTSYVQNLLETASGRALLKTPEEQSIARDGR